jgi:hypothetical protein
MGELNTWSFDVNARYICWGAIALAQTYNNFHYKKKRQILDFFFFFFFPDGLYEPSANINFKTVLNKTV